MLEFILYYDCNCKNIIDWLKQKELEKNLIGKEPKQRKIRLKASESEDTALPKSRSVSLLYSTFTLQVKSVQTKTFKK